MTEARSLGSVRDHVAALQDQLADISLAMRDLNVARIKTKERIGQARRILEIAEQDGLDAALLYKLSN